MTGSPRVDSQTRLKPAPSAHSRMFDGELVILDLAGGEYFALDSVGSQLWIGLEQGKDIAEIAHGIVDEYAVTLETALADLSALAAELLAKGLLVEARE